MPKMQTGAVAKHGGAGRGQGRKPADGATGTRRVTLTLDEQTLATLRALGSGNISLGVRLLAARHTVA